MDEWQLHSSLLQILFFFSVGKKKIKASDPKY